MGGTIQVRNVQRTASGQSRVVSGGLTEPLNSQTKQLVEVVTKGLESLYARANTIESAALYEFTSTLGKFNDTLANLHVAKVDSSGSTAHLRKIASMVEHLDMDNFENNVEEQANLIKALSEFGYLIWSELIVDKMRTLENMLAECTIEDNDKIGNAYIEAGRISSLAVRQKNYFSHKLISGEHAKELHDINNIFSSLVYKISIALGEDGEEDKLRVSGLRGAQASARFVAEVLRNQTEGRKEQIVNLDLLIAHVYELIADRLESSNVNFVKTYFDGKEMRDYFVECCELEMTRIIMNLIKNAVEEFNDRNTKIEDKWIVIVLKKADNHIILTIHDTGPEMTNEKKAAINTVLTYQNLDQLPRFTTKGTGSGWGLRIIRQYVESNRGTLNFENDKEGTVFTLTFKEAS